MSHPEGGRPGSKGSGSCPFYGRRTKLDVLHQANIGVYAGGQLMPSIETLAARVAATNAEGTLQDLISLDDLWTVELERRVDQGSPDPEEIEAFSTPGDSTLQRLEFVPGQMSKLAEMFEEIDSEKVKVAFGQFSGYPKKVEGIH